MPTQRMQPDLPFSTPTAPADPTDLAFLVALRAAVQAGTPTTSALHDAVCRLARAARARQVPSQEIVDAIARRLRSVVVGLPARLHVEFERQLAWWVAQEYHRDD